MNSFVVLALALLSATAVSASYGHGYGGGDHGGYGGGYFQPANYHFAYGVHDPHTHDVKDQHEHRVGDHAKGGYSLYEPDGTKRVVEYSSDPHHGFQAVVHREGVAVHPASYGKHGHGGHGGHGGYGGGYGGTSYVKTTHWGKGSGK